MLASGLFFASESDAAAAPSVKVQVNDDLVHFPDAQPYIDTRQRTQTPVRMVSEKMGYKVAYAPEGSQFRITISNNDKTVQLKTGQNTAVVDGVKVAMDTTPVVRNGRTYVPISFVSKSFGTPVQWDGVNRIAMVNEDGQWHAPAWYAANPALNVVTNSKYYIGVPYLWGGTTPSGFDCSGFVQYMYRQQGVYLPRTANQMYTGAGYKVSSLKPGDLVFFSDTKSAPATHVGIYMGNWQFISATNTYGVKIDSMSNPYWAPRYFAAKRVF